MLTEATTESSVDSDDEEDGQKEDESTSIHAIGVSSNVSGYFLIDRSGNVCLTGDDRVQQPMDVEVRTRITV